VKAAVQIVAGAAPIAVAKASQIVALDKVVLTERVGKLSRAKVDDLLASIDVVLGR
jgi:mRNA-degrading endonuclease toxin of MazEF toxin-antitoxin module